MGVLIFGRNFYQKFHLPKQGEKLNFLEIK